MELTYREIVDKYKPGIETEEVDSIYFNGPATIRRKTQYALDAGLGGVMIWEIGQDVAGSNSLLRTIDETVHANRK